jgi:TonB family protein
MMKLQFFPGRLRGCSRAQQQSPEAEVAELADAHGSGPCARKGVGVRVPSSAPRYRLIVASLLIVVWLPAALHADSQSELERQLAQIFVNRSFTLRNFYVGDRLQFDGSGTLTSKARPGFWSRDGMVLITSVKLKPENHLLMQGDRYCMEFDVATGEFSNVRTGDHLEIGIDLKADQKSLESIVPVLQRVFITSREKLSDIAPPYWRNCLAQRVSRGSKDALWECQAENTSKLPQVAGKKPEWELPAPDTSLHDGTRLYLLEHRVAYFPEEGASLPKLQVAPDPLFRWLQRRVKIGQLTCVLAVIIGEDGRMHDVSVLTPVGRGIDDEAVEALQSWRFEPAMRKDAPIATYARIVFLITEPSTRPSLPPRTFVY